MGVKVVQLTSKSHHENILASLYQLRLHGHLSDVTVQVAQEGDVQEFQAHQVILAASSGYFKNIFLAEDTVKDKLLLSNMHSEDFSKFLEFVYTGKVEVARDKIEDIHAMAQFLDCEELLEVCGQAMSAGLLEERTRKTTSDVRDDDGAPAAKRAQRRKLKTPSKNVFSKPLLSPQSSGGEVIPRCKPKIVATNENRQGTKLKVRLAGHKVLQRHLKMKRGTFNNAYKVTTEDTDQTESSQQADAQTDAQTEKPDSSVALPASDVEELQYGEDAQSTNPEEGLFLSLGEQEREEEDEEEEEEEEEDVQLEDGLKRTSKAQFHCNQCQRTFHYERSYLKHISTYHGVKAEVVHRCDTCLQTFANRSNLKIHEKHVHSNERLFTCDSCDKTFKRKKDVVRHQRQVHERDTHLHVCSECGKALSSKTALVLHERTHSGEKPFECTDCGSRFTQNSALKMHHRTHSGEKPFACDECDTRFTQKHMLTYHKKSHSGEKPFMCEACGKSFASKEYLRYHSNIHTGFKPYKCQECGRGFAQRNSLHQHIKIHTGERPYSCKFCEKQFTQLNALQRHQRIHTGEKPYMCGLCSRTFTDKSTLRRHTMVHDSDAPWKTYLVVLEGNVEDKKPKMPTKRELQKAAGKSKRSALTRDGDASSAADASEDTGLAVVQPGATLPSEWAGHGAIALVSHGSLGGITVIHTEVPPGTQIQPMVTADSTVAISVDSSAIPVPFSIPFPSAAASTSLPEATLSVPESDGSDTPVLPTSSVLEAAASETILAPVSESEATLESDILPSDIQTVVLS